MGSRIESVRPGGTVDANFREIPLPELLFGILRANLSGRVDFALRPEPRNRIFFYDGVPIGVDLPDTGLNLIHLAVERGFLGTERAKELERSAEINKRSPAQVLIDHRILGPAELDALEGALARSQLIRLFDFSELGFRFIEGAPRDERCALAILELLPVVYRGLKQGRDRHQVNRFLEAHERSNFKLGPTYPQGVDPFGWGVAMEAVIAAPERTLSLAVLADAGLDRETSGAALLALKLAGMVELREAAERREPQRLREVAKEAAPREQPRPDSKEPKEPPGGLLIHRRQDAPEPPAKKHKTGPTPVAQVSVPASAHDAEYQEVRDRLTPLRGQNYFQLLRAAVGSDLAQLDRAYRFFQRRLEEEGNGYGPRAHRDLLEDAYRCLRDPKQGPHYTQLVEAVEKSAVLAKERLAFEALHNIERAIRAVPEGRTGTAAYLLAWAEKQDPTRRDVEAYLGFVDYWRGSAVERVGQRGALVQRLNRAIEQHPDEACVKLCYAYVYADAHDQESALRLLAEADRPDHPLVARIRALPH
ncbi:MAG: hypothetical protein IPG45_23010 [Deltaproteobacteria bacterium]|jgi:hypothetical protein|nr:hypothetical protein [Deltaproteobacteria bacterium]